ncbi:MAG: type I-E CRISPR-associated protein Cas7/Cse4/CasC, partial [Pseudomonadota bacterium]
MTDARFLQIHTLHSYSAALLNRDDSGLAKRIRYGGAIRTRVSSQCLKRHWRKAEDDPHALAQIADVEISVRSRNLIDEKVFGDELRERFSHDVLNALKTWFNYAVYGGNESKKPSKLGTAVPTDDRSKRQTLLLGVPELEWLTGEASKLASEAQGDAEAAFNLGKKWEADFKKNIKEMRESAQRPGGIASALFGRMVTSDTAANIDAPIHVAHSFTVHEEETESDYFTAVDDLKRDDDDSGADTIQETELMSGLFYGYVVIDIPGLVSNLTGQDQNKWLSPDTDRTMAAEVVHNLIYLIAEISPGEKLGS